MKKVTMVVLIGLAVLGAVYAGTRPEELKNTEKQQDLVAIMPKLKELENMPTEEQNKMIVDGAIGAMNDGDWELMSNLYSPRFVQHGPGDSQPIKWSEFELGCRVIRQKMPTARIEIEDIIAEGNKVAVRLKTIVTYKVNPHGIKTTAEKKEFTEMDLFRIEGGRIVEEWCEYDTTDWNSKMWQLKHIQKQLRFEWK